MSKRKAAALYYASIGWHVFPCTGKIPATTQGFKDATTDRAAIERWWDNTPDFNIGIATGKVSGIVVVDVDPRHNGAISLECITAEYGELPLTPRCMTGGGGEHYYFKYAEGIRTIPAFRDGIDIKSDGGYVIAPTSRTVGDYVWYTDESPRQLCLADVPSWLMSAQKTVTVKEIQKTITAGSRNSTLFSAAGVMRRKGLDYNSIYAALSVLNKERCNPPLPEEEVKSISRKITVYDPAPAEEALSGQQDYWAWGEYVDATFNEIGRIDPNSLCHYPLPYLEDALRGIRPGELIVMGADSGIGKTELALKMAVENAAKGKRVFAYFLEGDIFEIGARIAYQLILEEYLKRDGRLPPGLDYINFITNNIKLDADIKQKTVSLQKELYDGKLQLYARKNPLDKERVLDLIGNLQGNAELVVIDHLHYFEFLSDSEHSELTDIMKAVRKATDMYRIPTVLISHLRKPPLNRIFPSNDEFHGSSNIPKQADTTILIAPTAISGETESAEEEQARFKEQIANGICPTGIRIGKARVGISQNLIGIVDFNRRTKKYADTYQMATIYGNKILMLEPRYYPKWARIPKQVLPVTDEKNPWWD